MVQKCPSCKTSLIIIFYPEIQTELNCVCPTCSHRWSQTIRGGGKTIDWDKIRYQRLQARYRRQHRHDEPEHDEPEDEISDTPNFDAAIKSFDHVAHGRREINDHLGVVGDATHHMYVVGPQGGSQKHRNFTTARRRPRIDLAVRNAWIEAHKRPVKPC